jgi:RND family efflux transporter MFP subunit
MVPVPHGLARPSRRRWWRRGAGFGAALLAAVLAAGCGSGPEKPKPPPPEVTVTTPVTGEVVDYEDFTGRLSAVMTVEIRARVAGYVTEVPFKEGDIVTAGQLLFQIDPKTYRADLNQAKANLRLAQADVNLQEKNVERARQLLQHHSISQEDYETTVATWEKSKATVKAAEAARDKAQVYLDYTRVTVPAKIKRGRISRRFVDPGNTVIADNTMLTTIVTEDPQYAYFDVDERTYLELVKDATGSSSWFTGDLRFPVLMRLANEDDFLGDQGRPLHQGYVNFIDNQVNATTGTVRLRGVFDNPSGTLKAGLFARIRLPTHRPNAAALLVPDEALQSDQGRKFVYVVTRKTDPKTKKPVDVVEYRAVKVGQAIKGRQVKKEREVQDDGKVVVRPKEGPVMLRVIEGLTKGDRVIVVGMQRVRQGMRVRVETQDPPKRVVSPLAKLLEGKWPAPAPAQARRQGDKETRRQGDKETRRPEGKLRAGG